MEDQFFWPTILERENFGSNETSDIERLEGITSWRAKTFGVRDGRIWIRVKAHGNVVKVAHRNDEISGEGATAHGSAFPS
jgi:hypothetical protein